MGKIPILTNIFQYFSKGLKPPTSFCWRLITWVEFVVIGDRLKSGHRQALMLVVDFTYHEPPTFHRQLRRGTVNSVKLGEVR